MAERDPLDILAECRDLTERPTPAFEAHLLDELISELRDESPVDQPNGDVSSDRLTDETAILIDFAEESTTGFTSRRWLVPVLAVAAVVALFVGLTAVFADDDDGVVVTRPTAPTLRGVFEPAGTLPTPATQGLLRSDGRVLVFGGKGQSENGLGSLTIEPESILLFDVASGESVEIGATAASVDSAVALQDGRVLAIELATPPGAGGGSGGGSFAELIDPETGQIEQVGSIYRSLLSAAGVLLTDGKVLFVGDVEGSTTATVLFDPETATFISMGRTSRPMRQPTATLLADGRVLVVGEHNPVAEIYDPTTDKFTETGSMSGPREAFTASRLEDGRVLIAGGWGTEGTLEDGQFTPSEPARLATTAEIYDPATGTFSTVGPMVTPRVYHFAVTLDDGRVLLGGGSNSTSADSGSGAIVEPVALDAEVFDPDSGSFTKSGTLGTPRFGAGAVRLSDGRVLVIGSVHPGVGKTDRVAAASLEIFE